MMQYLKKYKYILYNNFKIYTLILLPAIISVLWHLSNNQLPITDAIDYLWPAFHIFSDISKLNVLESIFGLYMERGWRPTIFHLFYIPFMVISGGNMLFSVGAVHTFFTLLSTIFIYKIFNYKINKITSALCASFLAMSSAIIFGGSSVPGFTEVGFICVFVALIYFLVKKNNFTNRKDSFYFSILFFLLFTIRPVEALLHITLPILIFCLYSYKHKKISIYTILSVLLKTLILLIILFSFAFITGIESHFDNLNLRSAYILFCNIFLCLIILFPIVYIYLFFIDKKVMASSLYFERSILTGVTLSLIWWMPYFINLYEWVYRTSLGDVVTNMVKINITFIEHINILFLNFGIFTIFSILVFFILGLIFKLLQNKEDQQNFFTKIEIIIISTLPVPFLFYFFSVQTSFRKISTALILLLIFLLIVSLKNVKKIKLFNYSLLFLVVISFFSHASFILGENQNRSFANKHDLYIVGSSFPNPVTIRPNPHDVVVENLNTLRKKYNLKHITLPIDERSNPVDPFLISIMTAKKGFSSNYPYTSNFIENLNFIEKYEAALVINPDGKIVKSKKEAQKYKNIMLSKEVFFKNNESRTLSPNQRYVYFIQYLFSKNELENFGWKTMECFIINEQYDACLITKIKNK